MNMKAYVLSMLGMLVVVAAPVQAADKNPAPAVELSEAGKALESKYTAIQTALKAELERAIPKLAKLAAWQQAILAEEGPEKEATAKAREVARLQGAEGRLRDLEDQLKYAPQTLEDAQENLARARARGEEDPERMKVLQSAESFLKSRQGDIDRLKAAIEKAKVEVEEAKVKLPEAIKAAETAKQVHEKALAATWKAMDAVGVSGLLSSNSLDAKLAQYIILKEATPKGLADFAQQSTENQKLVDQLFADKDLMLQMLVADGASGGKYGQAMKIYTDIQKASSKAKEGVYQRLAMAISLAHAELMRMVIQGGVAEWSKDPASFKYIDPVQRYLNFEKWYKAGEIQKGFKNLNVWNLRRVVDCGSPDEMLVWARQMLHTLRPDCIPDDDDTMGFVPFVDHEIAYGSGGLVNDLPDKHFMQNILANGGICGRRGFFCRFILQAFGVPAIERVEPGHSTVALWHPSGWKTVLGGDFGKSNRGRYSKMGGGGGGYGADVNFVASAKAREDETAYLKVKRAQWIGTLMGEAWKPGLIIIKPSQIVAPTTWSDIALHEQRRINAQLDAAKPKSSADPERRQERTAGRHRQGERRCQRCHHHPIGRVQQSDREQESPL